MTVKLVDHEPEDLPKVDPGIERHLNEHFAADRREARLATWGWIIIFGMLALGVAFSLTKYAPDLKYRASQEQMP